MSVPLASSLSAWSSSGTQDRSSTLICSAEPPSDADRACRLARAKLDDGDSGGCEPNAELALALEPAACPSSVPADMLEAAARRASLGVDGGSSNETWLARRA